MAWLAIIYVVVVGLDVIAWFATRWRRLTRSSASLLLGARALFMTLALGVLRDFTVSGDAAPAEVSLQHLALPILYRLEADGLAGRPAPAVGSDGAGAAIVNARDTAGGGHPLRIRQRIC